MKIHWYQLFGEICWKLAARGLRPPTKLYCPKPFWKRLQLKFDRLAGIRRDEFSGLVPTDQTPEFVPPPMSERERIRLGIFR